MDGVSVQRSTYHQAKIFQTGGITQINHWIAIHIYDSSISWCKCFLAQLCDLTTLVFFKMWLLGSNCSNGRRSECVTYNSRTVLQWTQLHPRISCFSSQTLRSTKESDENGKLHDHHVESITFLLGMTGSITWSVRSRFCPKHRSSTRSI